MNHGGRVDKKKKRKKKKKEMAHGMGWIRKKGKREDGIKKEWREGGSMCGRRR